MSVVDETSEPAGRQISRRTLVRAGATAAWTIPAVQIIAAAPAFATNCSCPPDANAFALALTATWVQQNDTKWFVKIAGTITNNSGAAVTSLTVCITVPTTWSGVHSHSTTKKDWDDSYSGSGSRTMVFTSSKTVPNGGTWDFGTSNIVQIRDDPSGTASSWPEHDGTKLTVVAYSGNQQGSTVVTVPNPAH